MGLLNTCTVEALLVNADKIPCTVCRRVGGAFGGKVTRSLPVAGAAAVAATATGRRVRFALTRNQDFRLNGGTCNLALYVCSTPVNPHFPQERCFGFNKGTL